MMEYTAAKAAGEQLCRDMMKNYPHLEITIDRLPRLPSDQTQSLIDLPYETTAIEYLDGVVERVLTACRRP
jgi:hypothetical protein